MNITFAPRGVLQIDDARIIFRNFRGAASKYNREGERNFAVIIPDQDTADKLINDVNRNGVGWNVKIRPPREDGDDPFIYLPVKVKFSEYGPNVYLVTNGRKNRLDEESIACLDDIEISRVDLDIRPYDDMINGKPFRAAYLKAIQVVQEVDRFREDMHPDEDF
jgi:hypothetical protein